MVAQQLNQRQIFGMKRATLEKRVNLFFDETGDVSSVLQYLIAILIRNRLTTGDFSLMCSEIIHKIFLQTEPSPMLRKSLPFFFDYFNSEDYQKVIARMFVDQADFYEVTKETSVIVDCYLKEKAAIVEEGSIRVMKSVFKDASGKRHTWSLRDYNPANSKEETRGLLKMLNLLTIFKNDKGVRKFVEYVKYDTFKHTPEIHHEEAQAEIEEVEEVIDQTFSSETVHQSFEQREVTPRKPLGKNNLSESQDKSIEDYVAELEALDNIELKLPAGIDHENLSEADFYQILRESVPNGSEIPEEALRIYLEGISLSETTIQESDPDNTENLSSPNSEKAEKPERDSIKNQGTANAEKERKRKERNENRILYNKAQKKQGNSGKKNSKKKKKNRKRK